MKSRSAATKRAFITLGLDSKKLLLCLISKRSHLDSTDARCICNAAIRLTTETRRKNHPDMNTIQTRSFATIDSSPEMRKNLAYLAVKASFRNILYDPWMDEPVADIIVRLPEFQFYLALREFVGPDSEDDIDYVPPLMEALLHPSRRTAF